MKKILLIVLTASLIQGCSDEKSTFNGDWIGFVTLIDESGFEIEDKSEVSVTLGNSGFSAQTNEAGRFLFKNVPTGSYKLKFSKTGFATYETSSNLFIGGDIPSLRDNQTLYKAVDIKVNSIDVSYNNNSIQIQAEIDPVSYYSIRAYLKTGPNVSNQNYSLSSGINVCCGSFSQFYVSIYLDNLNEYIGQDISIALYSRNRFDNTELNSQVQIGDLIHYKIPQ